LGGGDIGQLSQVSIMPPQWPGPDKKRRKFSARAIRLIKLHFVDDLPAAQSAWLAGYKGKSTAALCNAAQRTLIKFLEDPQAFFSQVHQQTLQKLRKDLRKLRKEVGKRR
jgi:hypothetical protein